MLSVRLLRVPYTRRSHLSAAQTLDEVVCEGLVARIKLKNTSATNTTHAPLLSDKSTSSAKTSPPLLGHQIVVVTFPSRLLLFARFDAGYSSALLRYVGDLNARVLTPLRID